MARRRAPILSLVNEVRRNRDALVRVLTICQDADDGDSAALRIRFEINEALGLYPLSET